MNLDMPFFASPLVFPPNAGKTLQTLEDGCNDGWTVDVGALCGGAAYGGGLYWGGCFGAE